MHRPRLSALALVTLFSCDKGPESASAEGARAKSADAETPTKDAKVPTEGTKPTEPDTKGPSDGLGTKAAGLLDATTAAAATASVPPHEGILGHVMMPNFVATLEKVQKQVAPPSQAGLVNLGMLQMAASAQLGSRSSVATNIDLTKPLGCAWVDTKEHEIPLSCVVGYTGGAEALIKDLGEEGKAPSAAGHLAQYVIDGEAVYIDALDDSVVLSSHPSLFDKSQDYLRNTIVERKDKALGDIEMAVYVTDAAARYQDELAPLFEEFKDAEVGTTPARLLGQLEQMEHLGMGFGFDESGAYFSGVVHAKPGTELVTNIDDYYGGALNKDFVGKLPEATFVVAAAQLASDITGSRYFDESLGLVAKSFAEEFGGSAETIKTELLSFATEQGTLYDRDIAVGAMFLEGTLGGAVLEVAKKSSGRDSWKTWSAKFTPEAILNTKLREAITWKFEPAAIKIGDVEIDRWMIEPTAEGRKEILSDSDFDHLRAKWPAPSFTIDRAELDDRVIFIITPMGSNEYMKAALEAVDGKGTIREHAGYKPIESSSPLLTALYAVDVNMGANWLRSILPPREASEIPPVLGIDLSDVALTLEHPSSGTVSGRMSVSQPFIDQLRKLID